MKNMLRLLFILLISCISSGDANSFSAIETGRNHEIPDEDYRDKINNFQIKLDHFFNAVLSFEKDINDTDINLAHVKIEISNFVQEKGFWKKISEWFKSFFGFSKGEEKIVTSSRFSPEKQLLLKSQLGGMHEQIVTADNIRLSLAKKVKDLKKEVNDTKTARHDLSNSYLDASKEERKEMFESFQDRIRSFEENFAKIEGEIKNFKARVDKIKTQLDEIKTKFDLVD